MCGKDDLLRKQTWARGHKAKQIGMHQNNKIWEEGKGRMGVVREGGVVWCGGRSGVGGVV